MFQNNLIRNNVGGLSVRADSRGSATSLRGWIHNNLFFENHDLPCLRVEGKPLDCVSVLLRFLKFPLSLWNGTLSFFCVFV